jgi:glycosyltransferase involved in cell wall biosynthesis
MVETKDNGSLRVLSTESSDAGASLSVVIPLFNEESNVADLYQQLCGQLGADAEIVFVDDGSTDGTFKCLTEVASADSRVQIVRFRRNFGQTAALSAGIDRSRGDIIVPMDGDLQNDPRDIPRLLDKLAEGYDVVSGWRQDRKDPWARRIPSRIANWVISVVSGVRLHDYGCSLKAYRRSVLADVRLYGEMHRFVPIYATWQGARVAELPVTHHPRSRGRSHYGFDRTPKVILDLIVVKFLESYATKPIYVFGGFGLLSLFAGFVVGAVTLYLKFSGIRDLVETPLPLLTALLILVGILSVLLGLVAELTVRTYYESQDKKTYVVWEAEGPE